MGFCKALFVTLVWLAFATIAEAHDPVFGVGPHVLFKDGVELHGGGLQEKASDERLSEAGLELKYGITGDWVVGIGTSYLRREGLKDTDTGRGPTDLSTKYRFWRNDMLGAQESAAVLGKVILDDGNIGQTELEGSDYLLGLTYGYEGRKWYRWASVRHRFNSDTASDAERPNIWLLDLVVGIRYTPTEYLEPDWVWMLELNGEIIDNVTNFIGNTSTRVGGDQWFLSPGLMWTHRNVAIKTGIQLPLYDDLAVDQKPDDYRAKLELEWHF
tara:strand:- start:9423 stop:10235 length:813 start_codon:yes stop_codon:yes gene_type:complete